MDTHVLLLPQRAGPLSSRCPPADPSAVVAGEFVGRERGQPGCRGRGTGQGRVPGTGHGSCASSLCSRAEEEDEGRGGEEKLTCGPTHEGTTDYSQ